MSGGNRSAVVLGARTTGGAICARLVAEGWQVSAVARSPETLRAVRTHGARPVRADVSDPDELAQVLTDATQAQGGLDLVVNALAGPRPPGPFGGGPIADADLTTLRRWGVSVLEQTFVFLHAGAVALGQAGGGTLIQLTGGSSRHARPGSGPWAAGSFGSRALVQAAANELPEAGIHVALLIVDGAIEPADRTELADIAEAVLFLARPGKLRRPNELQLTRSGEAWRPA